MGKNSKVLTGCGIGCGAVVVILIILGVIGYNFISEKAEKIEEFETVINDLEDQYKDYDKFTPEEQLLSEEKLIVFMDIRDSIKMLSSNFTKTLETISIKIGKTTPDSKDNKSFLTLISMINTGFSAIPEIADYFTYRHKLLKKYQMNIGEYYYYFAMIYYVALKVDMGDGPNFPVPGNSNGSSFNYSNENNSNSEEFVIELREKRTDRISAKVNNFMLKIFRNYLESENPKYPKLINRQIELMQKDKYRLPFKDSTPGFISKFFENHKDRLKTTYVKMLNPLELNPFIISKTRKSSKRESQKSEIIK